jgi:hypothetical protein
LVAWASFKKSDFAVTRGALASYASSPGVSRGFCGRCGTPLTYVHAERGDEIDITVASLRDPGALTPVKHLYTEHKLPWVRVDDGLPQFPRFTADGGVT